MPASALLQVLGPIFNVGVYCDLAMCSADGRDITRSQLADQ
jgi:hypothetical protein